MKFVGSDGRKLCNSQFIFGGAVQFEDTKGTKPTPWYYDREGVMYTFPHLDRHHSLSKFRTCTGSSWWDGISHWRRIPFWSGDSSKVDVTLSRAVPWPRWWIYWIEAHCCQWSTFGWGTKEALETTWCSGESTWWKWGRSCCRYGLSYLSSLSYYQFNIWCGFG